MTRNEQTHPPYPVVDLDDVRDRMGAAGSHWFDAASVRFFRTRFDRAGRGRNPAGRFVFVTSETGPSGVTAWSVRVYDPTANDIKTAGEFCRMTRPDALRFAREVRAGEFRSEGHV